VSARSFAARAAGVGVGVLTLGFVVVAGLYVRACSETVSGREIPGDRARTEVAASLNVFSVVVDGADTGSLNPTVGRETDGPYGYSSSVSRRWTAASPTVARKVHDDVEAALIDDGFRLDDCTGDDPRPRAPPTQRM
jgi:hypothetical protein